MSSSRKKRTQEKQFADQLLDNFQAIQEGPKRKTWSIHDLKNIKPLNYSQESVFHAYINGYNLCLQGSAGTGKSYLAIYLAMLDLLEKRSGAKKLIIVRSTEQTKNVGFLPGTLEEKIMLFELPYKDIFHDLFGRVSTYDDMKKAKIIDFQTTTAPRGLTWNDAIIVVDETQNMSFHEINTIMTRIGKSSKIIFTGDFKQTDLRKHNEVSGINDLLKVIDRMTDYFAVINFTPEDIVRSEIVKSWIISCEECDVRP